ncbi:hypothetical protein EWM64_g2088 [Hericium alpestre]|uniref:F-box domain-containing protein n=1 Tax=Hericium alpestre TaxID=135208 RepID=A0A4Z0A7M6_9AGAM|nr:hypothetical protein EWM64_g2088 [Hericium alpestre]
MDLPNASKWVLPSSGESTESVFYRRVGWIRITHVCRSWRHQALAYTGLWKNIDSGLAPQWMIELTRRSRQLPFTLHWSIMDHVEYECVRSVVEEVSTPALIARLRALHIKALCSKYVMPLLEMLVYPAPLLEELELRLGINSYDSPRSIGGTVFASTMPKLRHLALEDCMPSSWDMPYLQNLTSLEIVNTGQSDLPQIMIPDCLDMLTRAPQLESLVLKNIFNPPEGSHHRVAAISLDHLSKLGLQCSIAGLILLKRNLQIPATSAVEVGFFKSHDGLTDLLKLLAPVNTSTVKRPNDPYWEVTIACDKARGGPRRILWARDDRARVSGTFKTLSIEYADAPNEWQDALLEICEHTRTNSGIVGLTLSGNQLSGLKKKVLQRILRCMPVTWSLRLEGKRTIDAVAQLQKVVTGRMGGTEVVGPELKLLMLKGVPLSDADGAATAYAAVLLAVLQARHALGFSIPSLTLEGCTCQEYLLEQLRMCVSDVYCKPAGDLGVR